MYYLKELQWKKLVRKNLLPEHTLKIIYIDSNNNNPQKKTFTKLEDICQDNIKQIVKALVGYGRAWKNVTHIVTKSLAPMSESKHHKDVVSRLKSNDIPEINVKGIKKFNFKLSNQIILCYFGFNLNLTAGNTVMAINYLNCLMKNNNKILLVSPFEIKGKFLQNLIIKRYTIIKCNKENHKQIFQLYHKSCNYIFIRGLKNIKNLKNEPYLSKIIIYELGADLDDIKELDNKFHSIITQSEKLKKIIQSYGVLEDKINIIEPFAYKYHFDLPKRNDNKIRLIYCGTLREEENILEIIKEFQKNHKERPEVVLKIVYGKIYGSTEFTEKVNNYIENGVKGITFKHNLIHKEACYEIATSDIGICWRKSGWGNNGEVSTKVKEYELYGLEIINNMIQKIGVITATNKLNKLENIIRNYKQQKYINKKLYVIVNNNNIPFDKFNLRLEQDNIDYELIKVDEKFNLGYCLNMGIDLMKKQNVDIFSKFDDDDIYLENYLLEQVFNLIRKPNCIVGKYNIPLFIPEFNNFYTIENFTKNNQFGEICRGSTIMFNINHVKHRFDIHKTQGTDTIFLKEHLKNNGKIYVTSFENYIWVRHLDKTKHTWNLDLGKINLKLIDDKKLNYKYKNYLNQYSDINSPLNVSSYQLFNKKIYIVIWEDKNKAKGINIDCEIIYNTLLELNYRVFYLTIPLSYLKSFNPLDNEILLDGDIYIFSEVCYADVYDFIFKNNKNIICVPNIDSYSSYKPIIKDRETDFINNLKNYSKNNKFNIWCKTRQIYNWLKNLNFTNIHYTHFCYNILSNDNEKIDGEIKKIFDKKVDYLLLDTGNSTTKRKYLEEVLDIFIENTSIPFTLLVKTTPKVYDKFIKNTKYEKKYENIKILKIMLSVSELVYIYKKCDYFVYCAKFDAYGLSLAQAIKYKLFIFTFDGLPWCEILESYPRKCLIKCEQDMSKSMGVETKGKALSQIFYKGDFEDLKCKFKKKENYEKIIKKTNESCDLINKCNQIIFKSNIKNYFEKNYKICNIYNNTSIGVISYKGREEIFIENLMNIILQSKRIIIFLNSSTDWIRKILLNISNIHVVYCDEDLKSLTKLKVINCLNDDVNLIVDDDIVYPLDYVQYTYNKLQTLSDKKSFYSYNGFTDKLKYPFTIKTQLCMETNCNLGTGTLFYNKNTLTSNIEEFLKKKLKKKNNSNAQLFCDKIFLEFCQENKIKTRIISPKYSFWLQNNEKMKYGLLELKKELNIYDLESVQNICFKDKLININNDIPNNILKFIVNKVEIINKKDNYFNYFQIFVKDDILNINDNVINIFNINLNDQSLFEKLKIVVMELSKIYN